MRRAVALLALLAVTPIGAHADVCDDAGRAAAARRVESSRHVLVFRVASSIEVGRHFSVDAVVCARDGAPPATGLRVDAVMPAHRHGMNYRPSVSPRGDGRFVADGLMFHMPGHWQLVFDVVTSAGVDRIVADVSLE